MIHDDELPRFKEVLRQVMKVRNFEQLRKDVLPYIEEIRRQSSRKFVDSMFSKKFWSTFLNKEENRDMKTFWESLPSLNGKTSPKKSAKKVKEDVVSSPHTCESENEKMQSEENLLTDFSVFPDQVQGDFWTIDENENGNEAQVHDFINQFDENEPQYPVQKYLFDTEDILSEAALSSSEDKQITTEEKPKADFLEDFWSAWNERSLAKNGFSMIGKHVQLPESQEGVQRFELNTSNNVDFFGLSQDSYKQASFST